MKFKKLITYAVISGLVVAQTPFYQIGIAQAETTTDVTEEATETSEVSEDEVSQEEKMSSLLISIKNRITIPTEYSTFEYSYNTYSETPYWYFSWNKEDGNGFINITCDDNGNIQNYYKYEYDESYGTPSYLQSELKGKVNTFLKRVMKDEYENLHFKNSYYNNAYSNTYSFVYERTENAIAVPDNYVIVFIDAKTGEVEEMNTSWNYDVTFPSTTGLITKDKASSLLENELTMKLEYHESYSEDGSKMTGELIYVPNKSYLAVDAVNGQVYDTKDTYSSMSKTEEAADSALMSAGSDSGSGRNAALTEEEIAKIDELSGLLTKKQAIASLKKYVPLFIDSNATTQSAKLYQTTLDASQPDEKSYIWRITLSDPQEADYSQDYYYQPYLTATVDAVTGKVISFYASTKQYNYGVDCSGDIQFTAEEGQEKAESFLKKYYSNIYGKTEYTDSYEGYALAYSDDNIIYGGMTYVFTRMENGIAFPANQILVSVDLTTGKIYNFNYSWYDDVEFEAADSVITANEARKNYLSCEGYDLVYEIASDYSMDSVTNTVRLVYCTDISPYFIDAITGEQVNYDGGTADLEDGYSYSDINQSVYSRAIKLLADMGIGFNSNTYQPDLAITKEEFNQLIANTSIYDIANSLLEGTGTITREEAAKYAITTLKLESIAKLNIFKSDYVDSSEITSENLGYVVLAKELGLITETSDGKIRPKDTLTRGEAAELILTLISQYQY